MRIYLLLAMAAGFSFIGSNCGGSGVGDPCVPEDEYLTGFNGFSKDEVNVESRSFQCLTRVCLVNHFEGRVSCPYGQTEDLDALGEGLSTCMGTLEHRNSPECQPGGSLHMQGCQVPTRDGSRWNDRIVVPVAAQVIERQAEDAVYCSCRCADAAGSTKDLCQCPSGFGCERLVEDLDLGAEQLAGSYCVRVGTNYNPGNPPQAKCDASQANCDNSFNIEREVAGATGRVGRNQRDSTCLPSGGVCGKDDTCCSAAPTGQIEDHGEGGIENIYEVTRTECDKGDVCP
jgi:hypothetical protein